MSNYPQLIYAVIINTNDPKKLGTVSKFVQPSHLFEGYKPQKDYGSSEEYYEFYMKIDVCCGKDLEQTKFYKKFSDRMFSYNWVLPNHIERIFPKEKDLTQEEQEMVDELNIRIRGNEQLSNILSTDFRDVVIDHCWYLNNVCMYGYDNSTEPITLKGRSLQYLIKVNVGDNQEEIDNFKKKLSSIGNYLFIRQISNRFKYIVLKEFHFIGDYFINSEYFKENWLRLYFPHGTNTYKARIGRILIEDEKICELSDKLILAKDEIYLKLGDFIESSFWYDTYEK